MPDRWDALELQLKQACPALDVRREEPMSAHTSFRVGGPARLYLRPSDPAQAETVMEVCARYGAPLFFLGNGSNLLVADAGYEGVVLSTEALDALEWEGEQVTAGCGVPLARLAASAAERGLTGLEFAGGIPGTVGGGVMMNAGAYGGELAQVTGWVRCLTGAGETVTLTGEQCEFSYRRSIFSHHPAWFISSARFHLTPDDPAAIRERMAELAAQRKAKQPLEHPSAGSTFKRPAPVNGQPVYAAALIDGCGCKGLRVGGAQVSEKHAGFIVNRGGATCGDILALMGEVRRRVYAATGVELEPEVRLLGDISLDGKG